MSNEPEKQVVDDDDGFADDFREEVKANPVPEKKKSSKKPLVAILVILFAIVLGLAGWKWYGQINEYQDKQNQADKQISQLEKQVSELKQSTTNVSSDTLKTYTLRSQKASFQYPNDWVIGDVKVEEATKGEPTESLTVTSPDKGFSISLTSTYGGVGGGCDEEDMSKDTILSVTPVDDYKIGNSKVNYVERIVQNKQDGKFYAAYGIITSNKIKVGEDQVCAHLTYLITQTPDQKGSLSFGNGYTALTNPIKFDTESDAKAFFKTKNYLIAKSIVQSLKTN